MKKMRIPQQMTSPQTRISDRKLRLDRETVRQLDAETLEQARGGEVYQTIVRPSDACPIPTSG